MNGPIDFKREAVEIGRPGGKVITLGRTPGRKKVAIAVSDSDSPVHHVIGYCSSEEDAQELYEALRDLVRPMLRGQG